MHAGTSSTNSCFRARRPAKVTFRARPGDRFRCPRTCLAAGAARDPQVEALAIAPGNAGTASIADQHDVDITSGDDVVALARQVRADLVVIGPEVPLVLGVADAVRDAGIACFGPSKAAAQIEGSKAFAKDVMAAAGVRTASSEIVDSPARLDAALDRFGPASR